MTSIQLAGLMAEFDQVTRHLVDSGMSLRDVPVLGGSQGGSVHFSFEMSKLDLDRAVVLELNRGLYPSAKVARSDALNMGFVCRELSRRIDGVDSIVLPAGPGLVGYKAVASIHVVRINRVGAPKIVSRGGVPAVLFAVSGGE